MATVAWFTGLSGAGKSSIATLAAGQLRQSGYRVLVLDGDAVRQLSHRHLGFEAADIVENNRLIAIRCREAGNDYDIVLVPIISPFRRSRAAAKASIGEDFVEVYIRASLEEVMRRDPKGLYKQVSEGKLQGFIGIAPEVPYEPPETPDIVLDTQSGDVTACARQLTSFLEEARSRKC